MGLTPSEGGASYEAEASALFARMTTPPSGIRKSQINTLIRALKTGGIWAKLDCLWLMAAADAQAARLNWIADLYNLTAVSSPTFTADRGYQGDGSSSYLDTGAAPSALTKFLQDDASLAVWCRTNGNGLGIGRGTSGAPTLINPNNAGTSLLGRLNGQVVSVLTGTSQGLTLAQRTTSNDGEGFRNGVSLGTGTGASTAKDTVALRIGNVGLAFSNEQFAVALIGASLSSAQNLALYNALNTYLTAIGAA